MDKNRSGQAMTEFMIGTLLVLVPVLTVILAWFNLEWSTTKCAFEAFDQARAELISTNRFVHYELTCGLGVRKVVQKVDLKRLEDLDESKAALAVGDLAKEVFPLLEAVLQLPQSPLR